MIGSLRLKLFPRALFPNPLLPPWESLKPCWAPWESLKLAALLLRLRRTLTPPSFRTVDLSTTKAHWELDGSMNALDPMSSFRPLRPRTILEKTEPFL